MDEHEVLNTPQDQIHYKEFKIILQADHFQSPQAFVDFWEIVRKSAKKFDVKIHENENAFESHVREVLFFDTDDFALYRNRFIVRLRTHYKNGWPDGIPELTVKFRHPDFATAAAVDVRPATPGGIARIKFKEEMLPLRETLGGIRTVFSHNCVLAMPRHRIDVAVGELAKSFPCIRHVEAKENSQVLLVNDMAVDEIQVDVGELHFGGGLTGKTSVAVWRNRKYEKAFCGEFAFQCRFDREDELHKNALKRLEDFYKDVQTEAFEWVSLDTTKTALVYQLGGNAHGIQRE